MRDDDIDRMLAFVQVSRTPSRSSVIIRYVVFPERFFHVDCAGFSGFCQVDQFGVAMVERPRPHHQCRHRRGWRDHLFANRQAGGSARQTVNRGMDRLR